MVQKLLKNALLLLQVHLIDIGMLVTCLGGYQLDKELVAKAAFNALQDFQHMLCKRQGKASTSAKVQYLRRIRFVSINELATVIFVNVFKRRMHLLANKDGMCHPTQLTKSSLSTNDTELSEQYVFMK